MRDFFSNINGDRGIWGVAFLLALFSFIPVYSASSNLAYLYGNGETIPYLLKHGLHLVLGFLILYGVHKIPYHYFKGLSLILLPITIILLLVTLAQGTTIGGANASRWIKIPIVGISFQTSALAGVVLLTFVARYMAKVIGNNYRFSETILPLWLPVLSVIILILPANFSTAAILFCTITMLVFLGGYPLKYLVVIFLAGFLTLTIFVLSAKAFPEAFPNRVDTWISRIENFVSEEDTKEDYQIERAKIAIATGGTMGRGPGKSIQRNFLPQSSSDFIYAIIVEEFGLIGAFSVLGCYLILLYRIIIISHKATDVFGKILVLGVGFPVIFQALINMGVAVELFPVTGQTLPLISSGGSSIWMTCLALGIVISVSAKTNIETTEVTTAEQAGEEEYKNPLDILSETI